MRRALVLTLLLIPAAAAADVAPPADYKDPCATLKKAEDEECIRCLEPDFKDKRCHERSAREGFSERCRGWNYSIHCRKVGRAGSTTDR
jgi:hypothetical protein